MRTLIQAIKRRTKNLFFPEIMVGSHGPPAMNRQQRRALEAQNRKKDKRKRKQS